MNIVKTLGLVVVLLLGLVASARESNIVIYSGIYSPNAEASLEFYSKERNVGLSLQRIEDPLAFFAGLPSPRRVEIDKSLRLTTLRRWKMTLKPDEHWSRINFGKMQSGVYAVRAEAGGDVSTSLLLVTNLTAVTKRSNSEALVFAANRSTGVARQASVWALQKTFAPSRKQTDENGLWRGVLPREAKTVFLVNAGNDWALSDSDWNSYAEEKTKAYVYTDRPVYRPGQDVAFKGTLRNAKNLAPQANQEVLYSVRASDNSEVQRGKSTTNAQGSFDAVFGLPSEPPLGRYTIQTKLAGEEFYATFYVEAYQKPEYAVTVTSERERNVQGESIMLEVEAKYLFGGAVSGARVSYNVTRAPHYVWEYDGESYDIYGDEENNRDYGAELVQNDEARLDKNGKLQIKLTLPANKDNIAYSYRVQAEVEDESRRSVAGNARIIVFPAALELASKIDGYVYKPNESINASVGTKDLEGQAVAAPVQLKLLRGEWKRQKNQWVYKETLVAQQSTQTDKSGRANVKFSATQSGGYTLRVIATDSEGRTTKSENSFWVTRPGENWYWNYKNTEIVLDKKQYKVGETVTAIIGSPKPDASMLVSIEAEGIERAEVKKLVGSSLTYSFKVTPEMSPNVYLSATIVGDDNVYSSERSVRVPKENVALKINIAPSGKKFKPGETGQLRINVTDETNKPVAAELGLSVVDEAIYLVRPDAIPNITAFFNAPRGNQVGTTSSVNYYFESSTVVAAAPRAPLTSAAFAQQKEGDAAARSQSGGDNAPIRKDLRDTILWLPYLVTDANGQANVAVRFPDNLTTWRASARAISQDGKTGQNTAQTQTTKDVIARLALPTFLVRGDTSTIAAIVNNTLPTSVSGTLGVVFSGLSALTPVQSALELEAESRRRQDVTVRADAHGEATVTATATTNAGRDALQQSFPVLPRGYKEEQGWAAGAGEAAQTFAIPSDSSPKSAQLQVFLTPSLTAAVAPALEYLVDYPYGCTEQTMSRFLPALLAKQSLGYAALPKTIAQNLPDIIESGLSRLQNFQHGDGGWGLWENDDSNLEMTSYVLLGLVRAKALGHKVKPETYSNAVAWLRKNASDAKAWQGERAAAYRALSASGNADNANMERFARRRDLEPYALANLALAYHASKETQAANDLLSRLLALRNETNRGASWQNKTRAYDWWYYWDDNQIQVTALALEAIATIQPKHALVPKVSAWLLRGREGRRWVSTQDTTSTIIAALALRETQTDDNTKTEIVLNGETITPKDGASTITLPNNALRQGENSLAVRGPNSLIYAASLKLVREPKTLAGNSKAGLVVSRRYEKLTPVWDKENNRYQYTRELLQRGQQNQPVTVGDLVYVTLEVDARGDAPMRNLMINDPIPAGFKALDERNLSLAGLPDNDPYSWEYWYSGRELRDERVDIYADYLWGKRQTVHYVMRAQTPGLYTALPTQAFLMYDPDVQGRSGAMTVQIRDRGQ